MSRTAISRKELFLLLFFSLISLLLIWFFSTPEFRGDDAISHFQFAAAGQEWGYWLDSKAFNGNYFPMGYGSLLALGLKVSGGSLLFVQVVQALMGVSLAWFGWILVRNLGAITRTCTFAVIALSPAMISMATQNGYEIVLAFTLMAALTLLYRVREGLVSRRTLVWFSLILSGLLIAVGLLCQGKILVLVPVYLLLIWRKPLLERLAFLSAALLPLGLWALRNKLVLHSWNPFSSNSAMSLWLGNNWEATNGELLVNPPVVPARFLSMYEASLNFILSQPEKAFALQLRKIARLLEPNYLRPDWHLIPFQNLVINVTMILIACVGVSLFVVYIAGRIWVGPPVLPAVGWMASIVCLYFVSHFPFLAEPRYTSPVIPIGICVSVPTAISLIRRFRDTAGAETSTTSC